MEKAKLEGRSKSLWPTARVICWASSDCKKHEGQGGIVPNVISETTNLTIDDIEKCVT